MNPIQIGSLTLENNIFCASLSGFTDWPMRQILRSFQPGLIFCEMVSMEALIRKDAKTWRLLDFGPDEHPIGAQIYGSNPKAARQAASIIEDLGFDLIDLNCGCPVPKVMKMGGSKLLATPELIGELISEMKAGVSKIPVSVKVRAGLHDKNIIVSDLVKIAEEAGASLITIHGRTTKQLFTGKSNLDYIAEAKKAAKTIKVFGNGDLFTPQDVARMFQETHCDGVLLARGIIASPWLVGDVKEYFMTKEAPCRSAGFQKNQALQHYNEIVRYASRGKAVQDLKRVGCSYVKNFPSCSKIRQQIATLEQTEDFLKLAYFQ